jgi:uncharacterized protein (DUF433 family)
VSDHFTLRFQTATTTERLKRRARSTGVKPSPLASRYVEEGLRQDDHPCVRFVNGPSGRRAAIIGTGLDVWEVIATVRDNENDVAEAAAYLSVPTRVVEAAVTYYGEFRDEIDGEIATNREAAERAHAAWRAGQRALAR